MAGRGGVDGRREAPWRSLSRRRGRSRADGRRRGPAKHPFNPRIAGVRVSVLAGHYRARLRRQLVAELAAGAGIALGVALVFGVLLSSSGLTGSAPALIRAVNGSANLQVSAYGSEGFSEALAKRIGSAKGVRFAAYVLREDAELVGGGLTGEGTARGGGGERDGGEGTARGGGGERHGGEGAGGGGGAISGSRRRSVQLVGLSAGIVALHRGASAASLGEGELLLGGGIGLPQALAHSLNVREGDRVRLLSGGFAASARVVAVLGGNTIGAAASAPIALSQLPLAQRLTGMRGRVSEVLIETEKGQGGAVAARLRRMLAGRESVRGAGAELRILEATAKPLGEATAVFAAIGAMVGLLFAANAMLLTLPERRRMVAELHAEGFDLAQIVAILSFQALTLGALGSGAGLALGYLLSHTLFAQSPVYLSAAFPVSSVQRVSLWMVLLALCGGLAAAAIGALAPLSSLRAKGLQGAMGAGQGAEAHPIGAALTIVLGVVGALLLCLVTALVLIDPSLTIVGGVLLALAVPCLVPILFSGALAAVKRAGARARSSMLSLAAIELSGRSTRSIALIGVAALAVYGSVAIGGARSDLREGLDSAVVEYLDTAQLWVAANDNFLTIDPFADDGASAAIARLAGVSSVRLYEGGLLDVGNRRVWVRARSPADSRVIQASQLLEGRLAVASRRIREGGWVAVSKGIAAERGLSVGGTLTLPTPSGLARLRVAAITTNVGWSPGAVTMSLASYDRFWPAAQPTALEVGLKRGVSVATASSEVRAALAGRPGLRVQSASQREAIFERSAQEGLRSLGEISTLLLITAALAVAAVLSASIWQRRARLASLKAQGFDELQLWRAVILESVLAIAVGCLDGAALGLYGHRLASRWLSLSTGFPAPFSGRIPTILIALAIVAGTTVLFVGALGFQSARVPPSLAFQDQ